MLERATACLKAGARDSLRCPNHTPRSQRMLHSTFWTHGAGDLDLPPWALPTHLPAKPDSTPSFKSRKRVANNTVIPASTSDGLFLDFLYPPQALAWLQRTNGQQRERWERRNARRLPEGFKSVQSSRGYASLSSAPFESSSITPERPQGTEQESDNTQEVGSGDLVQEDTSEDVVADKYLPSDSPGELAESEAGAVHRSEQALRQLRHILAGSRAHSGEDVVKLAWSLYQSLGDDDKSSHLLKKELLLWFSARETPVASAHCISLYWSLPLDQRPLEIYQAALTEFLRRRDYDFASGLHREALSTISNGSQITTTLFQYALRRRNWQLALRTKKEHGDHFSGPTQAHHHSIFWFNVAEMHDLVTLTNRLIKSWSSKNRTVFSDVADETPDIIAKMAEESILQLARAPMTGDLKPARQTELAGVVDNLTKALVRYNTNAAGTLKHAITSMLQQNVSKDDYANAHLIISNMYRTFRDLPNIRPSEYLLTMFLDRLRHFWDPRQRAHRDGFELGSIAEDYMKLYGRLSISAIKHLVEFYAAQGDADNVKLYAENAKTMYPDYQDRKSISSALVYVHARRVDLPSAVAAFEDVKAMAEATSDRPDQRTWNSLFYAYSRADDLDGALGLFKKALAAGLVPDEFTVHPITQMFARRGDLAGVDDMIEQYHSFRPEDFSFNLIGSRLTALVRAGQVERAEDILKEAVEEARTRHLRPKFSQSCNIVLTGYAMRPDIGAIMRIYKFMKSEKIGMTALTYSALMQALVNCRQVDAAKKILTQVLPRDKLRPTALHYAILITGYTHVKSFTDAAVVYQRMIRDRIRPTSDVQHALLKMKYLFEQERRAGRQSASSRTVKRFAGPLGSHKLILKSIESFDRKAMASKSPRHGADRSSPSTRVNQYIDFAMYVQGRKENNLANVEKLFRLYQNEVENQGLSAGTPPMRILTALMNAHFNAQKYDLVESYWKLAKEQADLVAPSPLVPDFRQHTSNDAQNPSIPAVTATPSLELETTDADKAAIGFPSSTQVKVQGAPTIVPNHNRSVGPKPAPGRADILTRPLRVYLRTLLEQDRITTMIKVVTPLIKQGYRLDIITWNRFIEYLCVAPDPPVLLAFILTERYLMPGFPGWVTTGRYNPKRGARFLNFEYMKTRYENKHELKPHYRTMLWLARAFMKLQEAETMYGERPEEERHGMQRLRGSMRQIRERAPQTVAAVQSIPVTPEKWQARILGGKN